MLFGLTPGFFFFFLRFNFMKHMQNICHYLVICHCQQLTETGFNLSSQNKEKLPNILSKKLIWKPVNQLLPVIKKLPTGRKRRQSTYGRKMKCDSERCFGVSAQRLGRIYKVYHHLIRPLVFSLVSVSAFIFHNCRALLSQPVQPGILASDNCLVCQVS